MHWTFIVQNNKILGWGTNNNAIPHKGLGFWNNRFDHREDGDQHEPKTHSELSAYKKAKGLLDPGKKWEAVNIRLNREGAMKMSKPCRCCYEFLKTLECSSVHFSTDCGWAKIVPV
jgi:hypothetical protein